jgi:FkbH-like protein
MGLSSKVLVVDLDNTLWGGIIGEDGLGGIRIGPPTPEGEAYQDLQRFLKELQERGVLLAVCSKNNPTDAESPFRSHADMILKLEDFVAFRASWQDKATGLRSIAEELSLGLDSFVFLDDNPLERAWVRTNLPQVIVPEGGCTPWSLLSSLQRGAYFEAIALTAEDLDRKVSYQSTAAIRVAGSSGVPLEDFLRGLHMQSAHGAVDATTVLRVAQLVNKTNQFNVTSRRYSADEVARMTASPHWWCHWFRLADRFGDHGLIGVLFARIERDAWFVDTWLMSCRVLGRRMEEFMCGQLLAAAEAAGARTVHGEYVRTEKNGMVSDLYPRMGFVPDGDEGRFRLDIGIHAPPQAPWIEGKSDASGHSAAA